MRGSYWLLAKALLMIGICFPTLAFLRENRPTITIRPYQESDFDAYRQMVEQHCYMYGTISRESLEKRLARPNNWSFAACVKNQPVGFFGIVANKDCLADKGLSEDGAIVELIVDTDNHRKGVGTRLVLHGLNHMRKQGIYRVNFRTRVDNQPLQGLVHRNYERTKLLGGSLKNEERHDGWLYYEYEMPWWVRSKNQMYVGAVGVVAIGGGLLFKKPALIHSLKRAMKTTMWGSTGKARW